MRARFSISLALAVGGFSSPALPICMEDKPYAQELDSAEHIFIATLTSAALSQPITTLKDKRPYEIRYGFEVVEVLKGNPSSVSGLSSGLRYHAPNGRTSRWAEETRWTPGDNVLVVATGTGDVNLSFCALSRPLDDATDELKAYRQRHASKGR